MFYKIASFAVSLFLATNVFASDPDADFRTRADASTAFDYKDNPSLMAFADPYFVLAYQQNTTKLDGSTYGTSPQAYVDTVSDLLIGSQFFAYEFSLRGPTARHSLTGSVSPFQALGLGVTSSWLEADPNNVSWDFGLTLRPIDLLSLGFVANDLTHSSRRFGLGLALRPLSFAKEVENLLTLGLDTHFDSTSFVFENVSARLDLPLGIGLRAWFDLQNNWRPSIELSLDLGLQKPSVAMPSLERAGELRISNEIRIDKNTGNTVLAAMPTKFLLFNDLGEISSAPSVSPLIEIPEPNANPNQIHYQIDEFVERLARASSDPSIAAMVVTGRFTAQSSGDYLVLSKAIEKFKAAGKKFYAYADSINDTELYLYIYSLADRLSINPNGTLEIKDYGRQRLYLKDFLDKLGISVLNLGVAETKSAGNDLSYSKMPNGEKDQLLRLEYVKRAIALKQLTKSRPNIKNPNSILADGPWLLPYVAKEKGFVDEVEYSDQFQNWVFNTLPNAAPILGFVPQKNISWGPSVFSNKVAVVYLEGLIGDDYGVASKSIGKSAVDLLVQLRFNPDIKAVIVHVNSGGGSGFMSDLIAREVKFFRDAKKPLVVVMGDYAASGGYYISAYAERIFAQESTITGSIGVTSSLFNFSGTLEKLGINNDGPTISPSNRFLDPTKPFTSDDTYKIKEYIDSFYQVFMGVVSDARKINFDQVKQLAQGQVWTGIEALSNGLIDEFGDLATAKTYIKSKIGGNQEYLIYTPGIKEVTNFTLPKLFGLRSQALESIMNQIEPYADQLDFMLKTEGQVLYMLDPQLLEIR